MSMKTVPYSEHYQGEQRQKQTRQSVMYNVPIKVSDAENPSVQFDYKAFNFENLVNSKENLLHKGFQKVENGTSKNIEMLNKSLEVNGFAFLYYQTDTCKQTEKMMNAAKAFFNGSTYEEKEGYSFVDDGVEMSHVFGYSHTNNPDSSKPGDREVFRFLTGDLLSNDQWNKSRFPKVFHDFPVMLKEVDETIYKLTESMAGPVFYSDMRRLSRGLKSEDKQMVSYPMSSSSAIDETPVNSNLPLLSKNEVRYGMFDCVNYKYDAEKIEKVIMDKDVDMIDADMIQKVTVLDEKGMTMMEVDDFDMNIRNGGKYYNVISEHVDPGLFVVNFGCEEEGLQLYDYFNKTWIKVPTVIKLPNGNKSYCGILWCGKTASQLTGNRIKGCLHRVVQKIMTKKEYEKEFTCKGKSLDRLSMWFELSCESQMKRSDLAIYQKSIEKFSSKEKMVRRKETHFQNEKTYGEDRKSTRNTFSLELPQIPNMISVYVNNPKEHFKHNKLKEIQINENSTISDLYEKASYRISVPYSKSGFSTVQPKKLKGKGKGGMVFLDRNKSLTDYGITNGSEIFAD